MTFRALLAIIIGGAHVARNSRRTFSNSVIVNTWVVMPSVSLQHVWDVPNSSLYGTINVPCLSVNGWASKPSEACFSLL